MSYVDDLLTEAQPMSEREIRAVIVEALQMAAEMTEDMTNVSPEMIPLVIRERIRALYEGP